MKETKITLLIIVMLIIYIILGVNFKYYEISSKKQVSFVLKDASIGKADWHASNNNIYAHCVKSDLYFEIKTDQLSLKDQIAYILANNNSLIYAIYFLPFFLIFHIVVLYKKRLFNYLTYSMFFFLVSIGFLLVVPYLFFIQELIASFALKFLPAQGRYYFVSHHEDFPISIFFPLFWGAMILYKKVIEIQKENDLTI